MIRLREKDIEKLSIILELPQYAVEKMAARNLMRDEGLGMRDGFIPSRLPLSKGRSRKRKDRNFDNYNNYFNFCPKKIVDLLILSPKVIIHYRLRFHAKTVEHADNGL